jgi:hypothetical protein
MVKKTCISKSPIRGLIHLKSAIPPNKSTLELARVLQSFKSKLRERISLSFLFISKPRLILACFNLKEVVFVTASDHSHEKSLLNLLESLIELYPKSMIQVFDLGMTSEAKEKIKLINTSRQIEIRIFNFNQHPNWMHISGDTRGEYAWKPISIYAVANEVKAAKVIFWLDAGCLVIDSLRVIISYTSVYGFWSSSSSGSINEWSHPKVIEILDPTKKYGNCENLNGAMVAFDTNILPGRKLLNLWFKYSQTKDTIGPEGSNRNNHRHDQTLLTILAHKYGYAPSSLVRNLSNRRILSHQDVENLLE